MSDMIIQIIAVDAGTAKSKAGKDYEFVEVTYKNKSFQDKVEAKKHNQYGDKNVFNTLKSASAGDVFTIERKKDDAGYWQWIGITSGTASGTASSSAPSGGVSKSTSSPAPKSTYETPEERQARQRLIVRQSSITSAIAILKTEKNSPAKQDVFNLAEDICSWVFEVKKLEELGGSVSKLEDFEEDIPL